MNKQKPYIGVTGVTTPEEARWLQETYYRLCELHLDVRYNWPALMVGVLVSSKTLTGSTNRWPERYPIVAEMASIFQSDLHQKAWLLNLVHFNYSPDHLGTFAEQTLEIIDRAGPFLTGFQFNGKWPELDDIKQLRQSHPELYVVLQVSLTRLNAVGWKPTELITQLMPYLTDDPETGINAVLLDPSGGLGRELNQNELIDFVIALMAFDIDIGVAGGLSASTLSSIDTIRRLFPNICIDAEGRLRDENDKLDKTKVTAYLQQAILDYRMGKNSPLAAVED